MKKSIIAITSALLIAFLLSFLFFSNIKLSLVEWYASSLIKESFGGHIYYDSIGLNEKGIIHIDGLSIKTHSIDEKGNFRFDSKRAEMDLGLSFFPPVLKLDILLINPNLSLNGAKPFEDAARSVRERSSWLDIQTQLTAKEGTLCIKNAQDPEIALEIDGTWNEIEPKKSALAIRDREGTFSLAYDGSLPSQTFALRCKEANIVPYFNFLAPFVPELSALLIKRGSVEGNFHFVKGKGGFQEAKGSLELKNLFFEHEENTFTANIPSFVLDVDFQRKIPRIVIGKGLLGKDAEITLNIEGGAPYQFVFSEGALSVETVKALHYQFIGKSIHNGTFMPFESAGSIDLFHSGKEAFTLDLGFTYHQNEQAKANLSVKELGSGWRGVSLTIGNMTKNEYHFFKDLFTYSPVPLPKVDFQEGMVDGLIRAHIHRGFVKEVTIDHMHFTESALSLNDLNLFLKAKKVSVKGCLNLTAKVPAECMTVQMDIIDAHVEGNEPFHFILDRCNAVASLENGVLKTIQARGLFQGMESRIDYNEANSIGALIQLTFPSRCLANYLAPRLKQAVERDFEENSLIVEAVAKRGGEGYDIRGKVDIVTSTEEKVAGGKFGFKASRPGMEEKHSLQEGWLFCENVDLNRFVAPLLFLDEYGERIPIDLRGTATIQGKFDRDGLLISYDAKDVVMESEDFLIEVGRIYQKDHFGGNLLPASHFFSFVDDICFGEIPIVHGSYKDKLTKLKFQDIAATIRFQNQNIHVENIQTESCSIQFLGSIDIDYSIPGKDSLDVTVMTNEIMGKAVDLRTFLSHLKSDSYISYIPLDGEIRSGKDECRFDFQIREDQTEVKTQVKGSLFEGSLPLDDQRVQVQELGFHFSYETGGSLDLCNIQGTLVLGNLKKPAEYYLGSDGITIENISTGKGRFNLFAEGNGQQLFCLTGVTKGRCEEHHLYIDILPDLSKSHCLGIHPEEFRLVINNWEKVELFSFGMKIDLSLASQGFKEGVLKFSSLFAREEDKADLSGILNLKVHYEGEKESLAFSSLFEKLNIGGREFKEAEIQGAYRNKTLFIDSFLFDDLSFAAEIAKGSRSFDIRFLGGSIKGRMAFGMEGVFQEENKQILGKIRHFEANPSFLELFQKEGGIDLLRFQGGVKGNGNFMVQNGEGGLFDLGLEMNLYGSVHVDNANIFEIRPFTFSYKRSKGVSLKNFEADFYAGNEKKSAGTINLGKEASYSSEEGICLSNVTFSVMPKGVKPLFNLFSPLFPLLASEELQLKFTESRDPFVGILSMTGKEKAQVLFLSLNEGTFAIGKELRPFRNFSFESLHDSFKLLTDFSCGSKWIRARLVTKDREKARGTMELSDPLLENSMDNLITLFWKRDSDGLFEVEKARGSLAGVTMDLVRCQGSICCLDCAKSPGFDDGKLGCIDLILPNLRSIEPREFCVSPNSKYCLDSVLVQEKGDEAYCFLHGTASVDTAKIIPYNEEGIFFDNDTAPLLGKNIKWSGTFKFLKNTLSKWSLKGKLDISLPSFKDFLVEHIEADINAAKGEAHLTNIEIHDTAGTAKIPEMQVVFGDAANVFIPLFEANSIRPAHLRSKSGPHLIKNKALRINDLKITNLTFPLKEPALCKAQGTLKFSNTSKALVQNTLFQIPKEIVMRLGLNPSVLTPVRGEVFFEFADEKIFLTRLKDVFSEGKGSKFYLASKGSPSYVDFDGNLMIQIRMKQYNILFKLAELFTVTVKGTYKKPLYFLQKQE